MAISSHIIAHSRLPTPRLFASSSVSLQFHLKPALYSTTISYGSVLPSNFFSKSITATQPRNSIVKATTHHVGDERQIKRQPKSIIDWVFAFTRPFVLRGTALGLAGTVGRALIENHHLLQASNWLQLSSATFIVLFAVALSDGYVNQINNIFDVDIDKVNKPHLSLASGAISMNAAWAMVAGSTVLCIGIAVFLKSLSFLSFISLQLVFGTMYSVPPFSTKRNTYGAILTMASMRGYIFHLLLCAGSTAALGLPFQLSPPVLFLAIFTTVFGLAVGIMKDLPDIKGDTMHKVPTLASKYGLKFAAYAGFGFIFLSYTGAIAAGLLYPHIFKQSVMVYAHFAIVPWVAFQAWKLNKENYNKEASKSFYLMMWNLISVECLIFPFI